MIYTCADQLIGRTPMLRLMNIEKEFSLKANLIAKLESYNPAGSVKDRVALAMINEAEKDGRLKPGSVIIEPTSGNTGIGLCSVAAVRGYRTIIVMPDSMSVERQKLMLAYGAEVVLTEGKLGMSGAIAKAQELAEKIPDAIIAGQFINPANPKAHYDTTGPEIYEDTEGQVDIFIAGVGTGGTLTGTGRYLKEKNSDIEVIAVEPDDSPLLSCGEAGAHGIQGIGANFIPEILDREVYDAVIRVKTEDAYRLAKLMGKKEGILCGISGGAALYAACKIADLPENEGKNIVFILPDSGERYLSVL